METFPRYWPFVRGIHWSPVDSPHKGQGREAFMLSLICAWTNGWANNQDAGDYRRLRAIMTSTNFSEIWIRIRSFSFKKIDFKISSARMADTKPLPEPVFTNHQKGLVAFIIRKFKIFSLDMIVKIANFRLKPHIPQGPMSRLNSLRIYQSWLHHNR